LADYHPLFGRLSFHFFLQVGYLKPYASGLAWILGMNSWAGHDRKGIEKFLEKEFSP
jgi:hypothetical protein